MVTLLDIETFLEHFECSVENYVSGEKKSFWCNNIRDDRRDLKKYLETYKGFMVTFNGIHFDFVVLSYIKKYNYFLDKTPREFCEIVYNFASLIISSDDPTITFPFKPGKWFPKITQIDLYLYWARLLRISKKISLKGLAVQLNYPVIQELPYPPDTENLSETQIQEINHYCSIHDLGVLRRLMDVLSKGDRDVPLGDLGTVSLRKQIVQDYGINAWSMDAPKIASEALLLEYCRKTGLSREVVSRWKWEAPTIKFGDLFPPHLFLFKTVLFKQVQYEWYNAINEFTKQFNIIDELGHGCKLSVGVGGIHSILSNQVFLKKDNYSLLDIDIESLYPQNIINFEAFRFPEVLEAYRAFKEYRVTQTKPNLKKFKGTPEEIYWKTIDAYYKVILNGTSGHLDSPESWLFNREGIMRVRCGGQLILLTMLEKIWQKNIEIIQVNTDGLTVQIKDEDLEWFYEMVKETEHLYNVKFEYAEYSKMVFYNVNAYLAVETNGKVKEKGIFVRRPALGNSTDFLIIPNLLYDYFVKGLKPETNIADYTDIFLFCASQKVDKSYQVFWGNDKTQRLNRYYVSKKGKFLYKERGGKKHHMLKGFGVQLYNNHIEQPIQNYNINYSFYLKQVNDIISEIERKNQLSLF